MVSRARVGDRRSPSQYVSVRALTKRLGAAALTAAIFSAWRGGGPGPASRVVPTGPPAARWPADSPPRGGAFLNPPFPAPGSRKASQARIRGGWGGGGP